MCVHKSKGKTLKKRFSKKRGLGERKKKKKTTNLSQRHRQLSSILIPTSQQFDTEWFFFFFFVLVFLLLQSKSQLKSSPQSSPSSSSNKFCECKNPEKRRDPESKLAHARNKQTRGKKNPSGKTKKHGK